MMVALGVMLFMAPVALAQKLRCVSKPEMKGENNVAACTAAGETFAYMDKHGLVRILSKEELELSMACNPRLGQMPAFSEKYAGRAPIIPMPRIGDELNP
jgi:hypothetical protein